MNPLAILERLAAIRPCFHSEKDFQHAFAWEIQRTIPEAAIRLEYRPAVLKPKGYVDVWVRLPGGAIHAIELKYKTVPLTFEHNGEVFGLLQQGAADQARFDYLKDVSRLESLVGQVPSVHGTAILLTNDASYWKPARSDTTVDAAYRLHDGRVLKGVLAWSDAASEGTKHKRHVPITLLREYLLGWRNYSSIEVKRNGRFRFLLTLVEGTS